MTFLCLPRLKQNKNKDYRATAFLIMLRIISMKGYFVFCNKSTAWNSKYKMQSCWALILCQEKY